MSELTYLDSTNLVADRGLEDTEALTTFWLNPEAVLDMVYGPARRVTGATPAHDHDEDGGESLYLPILQHSFGTYRADNLSQMGRPLGPPSVGSFVPVSVNGAEDRSGAKRLFCAAVLLPGGCVGVGIDLSEWHQVAGLSTQVTVAFRQLSSVNYKLGVAPEEASVDLSWVTVGDDTWTNHTAELADLSSLGDATMDRVVELSLWLTSDVSAVYDQRLLDLFVFPLYLTAAARSAISTDLAYPQFAARELKNGQGTFSAQLAAKIREIFNGLNRGLWGSTPGLLPDLTPDVRRRYREEIGNCHGHQGAFVPDGAGGVFGDGACLRDAQAFGFISDVVDSSIVPLPMGSAPNLGAAIGFNNDLTSKWCRFEFRRSIPAGCGELHLWIGLVPGQLLTLATDASKQLSATVEITPVGGGASIVSRVFCGPFASPLSPIDPDYLYCKLQPEDDLGYQSNAALLEQGREPWNESALISEAERSALRLTEKIYRVSKIIRVQLTYPPLRPAESAHATQDYDVKVRFKRKDSAGNTMDDATLQWILCATAPGY